MLATASFHAQHLAVITKADVSFKQEITSNHSCIIVVNAKGTPYQIKLLRAGHRRNISLLRKSNT